MNEKVELHYGHLFNRHIVSNKGKLLISRELKYEVLREIARA